MLRAHVGRVRTRLLLLIALLLVPATGLLWLDAEEARAAAVEGVHRDTHRLATTAAVAEQRALDATRVQMAGLGWLAEVARQDPARCGAALREANASTDLLIGLSIAAPDGTLLCSANPAAANLSMVGTPSFDKAVATGAFAVGAFRISRVSGLPTMDLAHPFLASDGTVQAVAMGGVDLEALSLRMAEGDLPAGYLLVLVQGNGTILARQPDHDLFVGRAYPLENLHRLVASPGTIQAAGLDGVERIYALAPLRSAGASRDAYVLVGAPVAAVLAPAQNAFLRDLVVLAAVGSVAVVAALILADRSVARPLETLARTARAVAGGDLGARTGLAGQPGEVGDVARSFDAMLDTLQATRAREAEAVAGLERANQRLQELDEQRAHFVNVAAHELANPLTPMALQVQLLRHAAQREGKEAKSLDILDRNVARLTDLARDILDASRARDGRLPMTVRPVDFQDIVRETVELYQGTAAVHRVDFRLDLQGPLPVQGDPARLAQVVVNLVSNAIKFTPAGGAVTVRTASRGGEAVLVVEDSGLGFDPGEAELLFRPFSRLHREVDAPAGTGLGLYLVRSLVEQHQGRITGHSEGPGRGARFEVVLPLRIPGSDGREDAENGTLPPAV